MNRPRTKPVPRAPELSRDKRRAVYVIGIGVWVTGAMWVVAHYFLMEMGPFGPAPHPLEFWSRASHGAFAFASLWLLGLLWSVHIPAGWRSLRRRWSGSIVFAISGWLVMSGFVLYYLGNDELISAVTLLHWSVGLLTPAIFLLHQWRRDPRG
jgi:hypothetical protein